MAMWGRKDPEDRTPTTKTETSYTPSQEQPAASMTPPAQTRGTKMESSTAKIGPSIQIKGELIGNEDLVIEGRVEGVVRLKEHHLTVGKSATIDASVEAKSIRIEGTVKGDVVAGDRIELATGSTLLGDIVSPRIAISDGARFKGSVDMDTGKGSQGSAVKTGASAVGKAAAGKSSTPSPTLSSH